MVLKEWVVLFTSAAGLSKVSRVAEALSPGEDGSHEIHTLSIVAAVTGILALICSESINQRVREEIITPVESFYCASSLQQCYAL